MPWTELPFGKHKGKTLPQVVFSDPDWFYWAVEKNIFKSKDLKKEACGCNLSPPRAQKPDINHI